jgi:benzodiazapine receptor
MKRGLILLGFFVICFGAAGIGGWLTNPGIPWLGTLRQPSFQPPNWIFGPVWTVLYGMMAVSGWLLYLQAPSPARTFALGLFAGQLILNVGWSLLFFYFRMPLAAFLEIILLLAVIWMYVFAVRRTSTKAAVLFIPYGLWVGFATLLTGALWYLNRGA